MFIARFLIPILVFIGGATGFYVYEKGDTSSSVTSSTPSELSATSTVSAKATVIKKNLSLRMSGEAEEELISSSKEVAEGDELKTSSNGRGIVEMSNGSTAVLDYDSSMVITTLNASGTQTSLALSNGSVWAQVKKVFGQGEFFEIRTQNAVAVVRGTSFGVTTHKDGSSTIFVSKGLVKLTPIDPVTKKELPNKAIEVSAGAKGMVSPNGAVTKTNLSQKEKQSEWYLYNNDETLKQSEKGQTTTEVRSETTASPKEVDKKDSSATNGGNTVTGSSNSTPTNETGSVCGNVTEEGYAATSALATPLRIISITPSQVSLGAEGTITLKGSGLLCVVSVTVGSTVLTEESELVIVSDTTITFPASVLSAGVHDVKLLDTVNRSFTAPRAITVR